MVGACYLVMEQEVNLFSVVAAKNYAVRKGDSCLSPAGGGSGSILKTLRLGVD